MSDGQATEGVDVIGSDVLREYLTVLSKEVDGLLAQCHTAADRQLVRQRLAGLMYRVALRDEREQPGDVLERALSMLRRTQGRRCAGIALPGYPALEHALYGMRGVTVLTGPTGAGKTALTLSIALNVAAGRRLAQEFGHRAREAVDVLPEDERVPVVYVTAELEPETLAQRMLAMLAGIGVREMLTGLDERAQHWRDAVATLEALMRDGWLHITTAEGIDWRWERGGGMHALSGLQAKVEDVAEGRPALVVLDSIATLDSHVLPAVTDGRQQQYRSDLDRDADIAQGLRRWRRQLLAEGSALLAVHEESKASTGSGDIHAARGSSRYAYSMDGMLALMHADAEAGTMHQHRSDDDDSTVRDRLGVARMGSDALGTDVDVVVNKARDGGKAGNVVMMRHMWGQGWVTEATRGGSGNTPGALVSQREARKIAADLRGKGKGGSR